MSNWYVKADRVKEWDAMSVEQRRKIIVQNKCKGSGRGHKRKIYISEAAEVNDTLKLGQDKPFLTQKQLLDITFKSLAIPVFGDFNCLATASKTE